jgi:hypothetical protein
MVKGNYYLSTAKTSTSVKPHIGNTYEIVLADAICRFKRMLGYDVYFQTGTDEHGQKIQEKAEALGMAPQAFVDEISAEIQRIWDLMNTSYDRFVRTTDPGHERKIQDMFRRLYKQGDIYKGKYEGWYCTPCESFWTESQLVNGKCPDCGRDVKLAVEEAYFFRLSQYGDAIMKHIEEHPEFIQPEARKNEMVNNFLKPGLQDLRGFRPEACRLRLDGRAVQLRHLPRLRASGGKQCVLQEILAGGRAPDWQGHPALSHALLAGLPAGPRRAPAKAGVRPPVAAERRQDVQVQGQRHIRRRSRGPVRRGCGALLPAA